MDTQLNVFEREKRISGTLLVQPDEGVSVLVVDRIGDNLPQSTEKSRILVIPVGARHKCQQESNKNFEDRRRPPPRAPATKRRRAHMHTRCALRNHARLSRTAATQWAASRATVARSTVDACVLFVRCDWTQGVSSVRKWLRKWTDEVAPLEALMRWLAGRRCAVGRRLPLLADDDCASVGHRRALLAGRCRVALHRCVPRRFTMIRWASREL
ncbi:zinc finger MYND domain-containing protein 15 [Dorcoceras hygrometricum]|uniref:Zinc finger MYND domain-containing protein 15 n=1 Tax=Dorcoceras hygrometricum TaxID=472368 RepID=A0A2Z7CEM1_9LAMI|nr:zinc finger MYND domain-containing protein 15 [Dorcoceras hygrometricum]